MKMNGRFQDYERLIHDRAWHWARKTGLNREDFLSAASETYVWCVLQYTPDRGAFSTYLWRSLDNRFKDLTDKEFRFCELTAEAAESMQDVDRKTFRQIVGQLEQDARWLAHEIFAGDAPVQNQKEHPECISPKKTKGDIRNWLHKDYGWGRNRIERAFSEIEKVLGAA